MTASNIPKILKPMPSRSPAIGALHSSNSEIGVVDQIQAMAYWQGGNSRHWHFPDPNYAPVATITTIGSSFDYFEIGPNAGTYDWYEFGVPWNVAIGRSSVFVTMNLVMSNHNVSVTCRAVSVTMVNSATTTYSPPSCAIAAAGSAMREHQWNKLTTAATNRFGQFYLRSCFAPSLPSATDRWVFIKPQVCLVGERSSTLEAGLGCEVLVYLKSLQIFDVPSGSVGS